MQSHHLIISINLGNLSFEKAHRFMTDNELLMLTYFALGFS